MKLLFGRAAVPVAGLGRKGARLASRRLVAVDDVHLDTTDMAAIELATAYHERREIESTLDCAETACPVR